MEAAGGGGSRAQANRAPSLLIPLTPLFPRSPSEERSIRILEELSNVHQVDPIFFDPKNGLLWTEMHLQIPLRKVLSWLLGALQLPGTVSMAGVHDRGRDGFRQTAPPSN